MQYIFEIDNATVARVSISGDGVSPQSAELEVTIKFSDSSEELTLRLGAGASPALFSSLTSASLLALEKNASIKVTYTKGYSESATPTLNKIAFVGSSFKNACT